MRAVLDPAAAYLPRTLSLGLARAAAWGLMMIPRAGIWPLAETQRTFGLEVGPALRLAHARLTTPLIDYVMCRRVQRRLESVEDWPVVEENGGPVREVLTSGRSLIVATGHFARRGCLAKYLRRVLPVEPGALATVLKEIPKPESLYNLRMRAQFGALVDAMVTVRPDLGLMFVGDDARPMQRLVERLRQPGRVVIISADAPWDAGRRGALVRPFAGRRARSFATGAARLARSTGAYLAACTHWMDANGRTVLEWDEPMLAAGPDDSQFDERAIHRILDRIELAIGLRPEQYVLDIGVERRWNAAERRWED
jgi:lauroyl/myristoyl acyltransferase